MIQLSSMSQSTDGKALINELIDNGMTDLQAIYTQVCKELDIPRPSARRIAGELRRELSHKIDVLTKSELLVIAH